MVALHGGEQAAGFSHLSLANGVLPGVTLEGVALSFPLNAVAGMEGGEADVLAAAKGTAAASSNPEALSSPDAAPENTSGIDWTGVEIDARLQAAATSLLEVINMGLHAMPGRSEECYVSGRHTGASLPPALAVIVRQALLKVTKAQLGEQVVGDIKPADTQHAGPAARQP